MQVVDEMPFERHVERTREYQFSVSFDSTIRTSRALERISSELENWAPSVYYDGYGSYDCPKKFLRIKQVHEAGTPHPRKKIKTYLGIMGYLWALEGRKK